MTDWKKRREEYIDKVWNVKKEGVKTTSVEYIECPLCQNLHPIDKYNWIDTCEGYMSLEDFEMIVKFKIGESITYAKS